MSSANSRYLAPKVPGGLMMSTGTEFTPGEAVVLQQLGDIAYVTGDIIYFNGSILTRLGIGSAGQVLTVAAGLPSWSTVAAGGASTEIPAEAVAADGSIRVFTFTHTPKIIVSDRGTIMMKDHGWSLVGLVATLDVGPTFEVYSIY